MSLYCHIPFSLLLLLEVSPQSGALSGKEVVAGEFNELMGTRKLHSFQIMTFSPDSPCLVKTLPAPAAAFRQGLCAFQSASLGSFGVILFSGDQMSHYYPLFLCTWMMVSVVKNLPASAGDTGDVGSVPELERSPAVRNDYLLQCSCLEDSMDREAWWATVPGAAKSWTQLNTQAS